MEKYSHYKAVTQSVYLNILTISHRNTQESILTVQAKRRQGQLIFLACTHGTFFDRKGTLEGTTLQILHVKDIH